MKEKILFVCVNNACHSQMAEGWARYLSGGDRFEFFSAGLERHELDVYAVKVMAEAGVDISSHTPKSLYAMRRLPCNHSAQKTLDTFFASFLKIPSAHGDVHFCRA